MANINAFIPPGATSSHRAEVIDVQNVQSRLSNPNTIDRRIKLQRMQDTQRQKLGEQFKTIDRDGNGRISIDELSQFFTTLLIKEVMARKTQEQQENPRNANAYKEEMQRFDQVLQQEDLDMDNLDQQLGNLFDPADFEDLEERLKSVDEIFAGIDSDGNGQISKEEFIKSYVDTRQRLIERQEEVMREMVDHARQQEEVKFRLEEAYEKEAQFINPQTGIRRDAKLKVHIVDAQNLDEGSYLVKVTQDNSYAETNVRTGAQPIWNEAIVFDITDPTKVITVELCNSASTTILKHELMLTDPRLMDYSAQGEEIWAHAVYDFEDGTGRQQEISYERMIELEKNQQLQYNQMLGKEDQAKLRVRCHYSYSDRARFESLRDEWNEYIVVDIDELLTIRQYLKNLTSPFGFLKVIMDQKQGEDLKEEDMDDLQEQRKGDTKYHKQEKQYEQELDKVAQNVAKQMGYRSVPWLGATWFFLYVQFILAMLTQIHRKDMITISVCAIGFYMLSYAEHTRRSQFRLLVGFIFCSIVQDAFWFVMNRDTEDDEDDGGLERGVKSFSRTLSFVSFFWRFLLAAVLWKDSLDFVAIIKEKSVSKEDQSLEQRVEQIMRDHHYDPNQNSMGDLNQY